MPETLTAPSGPVNKSALTWVKAKLPKLMLALDKCACRAASQGGGATARGPPGSGQGNAISGLSRIERLHRQLAAQQRREGDVQRQRLGADHLMIRPGDGDVRCRQAGARQQGPARVCRSICTSRPVSAEAKRSMAGRWLCEATKPGSASSVPAPAAMKAAGTNQRSFLFNAGSGSAIPAAARGVDDHGITRLQFYSGTAGQGGSAAIRALNKLRAARSRRASCKAERREIAARGGDGGGHGL